jgi:hypothetical protein
MASEGKGGTDLDGEGVHVSAESDNGRPTRANIGDDAGTGNGTGGDP